MPSSERDIPHVVIVGAGAVGASIAYHLSQRAALVTVLDAGQVATAATRTSFAWINARDKNPRSYHDLNRRSLDMWGRFQRELNAEIGIRWGGELRWATGDNGAADIYHRVETLQSWGYPIRYLGAGEIRAMEPELKTGNVAGGSYSPADGHVDGWKLARACLARAVENGARVRLDNPVNIIRTADLMGGRQSVRSVVTPAHEIGCDVLVLAAGARTPELASLAGHEIPHKNSPGATVVTQPVPPVFQKVAVVHTPHDTAEPVMNFRQLEDGSVMLHGGSNEGSLAYSSAEEGEWLFGRASQFLPSLERAGISEIRRSLRPVPGDGLPVLGFARKVPNLYFAMTHSGITLAPLIGELAVTEILDGIKVDLLEQYRADRFADQT